MGLSDMEVTLEHWLNIRKEEAQRIMLDGSGLTIGQWLQIRKDEAMRIDPETAEVYGCRVPDYDPYCVGFYLPHELRNISRSCFAKNPGSGIWVWFGDLPEETRCKLWETHSSKIFPDDLPF